MKENDEDLTELVMPIKNHMKMVAVDTKKKINPNRTVYGHVNVNEITAKARAKRKAIRKIAAASKRRNKRKR